MEKKLFVYEEGKDLLIKFPFCMVRNPECFFIFKSKQEKEVRIGKHKKNKGKISWSKDICSKVIVSFYN